MSSDQQLCSINSYVPLNLTQSMPATRLHPSATQLESFGSTSGCKSRFFKAIAIHTHLISPMIVQFAKVLFLLQELFVPLGKPVISNPVFS